ncbi:MAG: lysylphosphatidylglycerol synthase transmembrane domain-containing protein [Candidatus Lernaella stagnicola]|nr:lysylphosphatidylglycerol synthase transmembrane domain-containing protein [Candidatus Lernaella stagnicola]
MTDPAAALDPRPKAWRILWLGLSTALLLGAVFFFVPVGDILSRLRQLRLETILAALALSTFFNALVYADRWRMALRHLDITPRLGTIVRVFVATGPFRLLLPNQTGELAAGAMLAGYADIPIGPTISTQIYNKYLTLLATFLLLAVGVLAGAPTHLNFLRWVAGFTIAVLGAFFVLETKWGRRLFIGIAKEFGRTPGRVMLALLSAFERLSPLAKLKLLAYTIVFQASEIVVCYLLFRDLGIELPLGQLIAYVQLMILAAALPISFAGTGTREGVALLLLAPVAGRDVAVAAGLAYSFFEYLWPLLMGLPLTAGVGMKVFHKAMGRLQAWRSGAEE